MCAALAVEVSGAGTFGLSPKQPVIQSFHPLDEGAVAPSVLKLEHPAYLSMNISLIEEREVVDFEQRAVSFQRSDKAFGTVIWQYRYGELDEYLENRKRFAFGKLWSESSLSLLKASTEKKKEFNILQMELPVQYPTWAQRILGKDPPKLSITGFEEIIVSYEYTKSNVSGVDENRGTGGLQFDQNNEFNVVGSVGRLINVNIKATTKQGVDNDLEDPFKNFKLQYKGEGNELEDEVIQEVSAGAMGFSMPGTSLSGYSESHKGLIGIQVRSKIGPLELTTIASQERGEAQKTSFDLSGAGTNTLVTERDFMRYKMFFLDTIYRNAYLNNYAKVPEGRKVKRATLQIWYSNSQTEYEIKKKENKNIYCYQGSLNGRAYRLLSQGREYKLSDIYEGCVRFDSVSIGEEDLIAVCMSTNDGSIVKGDTNAITRDTSVSSASNYIIKSSLWQLKGANPSSSDSTFSLMWRNVYMMPGDFDQSKFKIQVWYTPQGGDSTNQAKSGLISTALGLTDANGNANIGTASIFDKENGLLIIPPYADAKTGLLNNEPFGNPALGDNNTAADIYYKTSQEFDRILKKYSIIMSGSEKVTASDGDLLRRDEDYTIDYQFGSLALTSKKALSKTRIDVEYQSETIFIPKSKVFLGMRGEMKLPFGNNSFLGASILYQDAASQDLIPKIGQEPYSKLLLDANTKMDFEPKWMTTLVNLLPFISADEKSSASVEVEVANSITNSNTDKQAYIDDFESSSRPYTLGLDERSWYLAAPPASLNTNGDWDSLPRHPPAWNWYWFSPRNLESLTADDAKVPKDSIFYRIPSRRNPTTDDKYENGVMNLDCQVAPPTNADINGRYVQSNPWAGIMYPIPTGSMDRTRDKYLEFYAKGLGGRLYIDMGEVSEDVCYLGGKPDGMKHDEDTTGTGSMGFDAKFDRGLDGLADAEEYWLVPNETFTGWEKIPYGDERLGLFKNDPARDKYHPYDFTNSSKPEYKKNYPYVNGKEENGNLTGGYDSKDLLGDGLSTSENYFRRFIDFDSAASASFLADNGKNYMVLPDSTAGNAKNGWHLYRIPLNDELTGGGNFTKYGKPRWDRIRFIRLLWTNFNLSQKSPKEGKLPRLRFARMQLVRNEWEDAPVRIDSLHTSLKLTATTINTEDNPEYNAERCPVAPRQTDESGNLVKESALRLQFDSISPGDTALVRNVLVNQTFNLSAYTVLTMSVHGDGQSATRNDLQYFFRFGNDDSTYYEYRSPLRPGWDLQNTMTINLREFSLWKQDVMGDIAPVAKDTTKAVARARDTVYYSIKYRNNRPPNFAGITWMAVGVTRTGPKGRVAAHYTGELWVDELKVQGIHDFNGWATRAAISTNWAGFMNLGGRFDYTGADFQQMTNTDNIKLGSTTLSGNLSASWTLSKFLPSQWGVSIPLGTSMSGTLTRPTLVNNSDVFLTDKTDKADGLADMYQDAINLFAGREVFSSPKETEARHYQSAGVTRSFYTGFDKTVDSKNPIVNMLLDRLSLDYKYSHSLTQTAKGRRADDRTHDYVDSLTDNLHQGTVKYSLTPKPAPEWTKWKPFSGSKSLWVPERLKGYELSLLPSSLEFNVADISYDNKKDTKERPPSLGGRTSIPTRSLTLMHGATAAWEPISSLCRLNYTLSINRNLDAAVNDPGIDAQGFLQKWKKLLTSSMAKLDPTWGRYFILTGERDRAQTATLNFDPTLWDWLTLSGDYSSNYKQTSASLQGDPVEYKNLGVNTAFHLSSTLTPGTLFRKLSEAFDSLKVLAAVFSSIEKGLGKLSLNNFTVSYSSTMSLTNNYMDEAFLAARKVSRLDFFKYQLGLKGRNVWDIVTGDMQDEVLGGMRSRRFYHSSNALEFNDKNDLRVTDRSFSARTSVSLPEPIPLSINTIDIKYSKNFSVKPDSLYRDTTVIFPELSLGASTPILNKVKVVAKYVDGVNMSSNYNYQLKEQRIYSPGLADTVTGISHRFAPLIGLDGKIKKWPIAVSYSHNYNMTSEKHSKTGTNSTSEHANAVDLNYEISKTSDVSEVRLLFWTVPLKGTLTMGMKIEQGSTEHVQEAAGDSTGGTRQNTSRFSINPNASYMFSDNFTGRLSLNISQTKDISVTTTSYIFSLSVRYNLK
jgi:hypothetical protein